MFYRRLHASRCWCVLCFASAGGMLTHTPLSLGLERVAQAHGRGGHLGSAHGASAPSHMDTPLAAPHEGTLLLAPLHHAAKGSSASRTGPLGAPLRSYSAQAVVCVGRLAPGRRLCSCSAVSMAHGLHGNRLGGVALPLHSAKAWLGAVTAGHQSRRPATRASTVDLGLGCCYPRSSHGHAAGAGAIRLRI